MEQRKFLVYKPDQIRKATLEFTKFDKMKLLKALLAVCLIAIASGAQYDGSDDSDAAEYIDRSQGTVPFAYSRPAHPRGHAAGVDSGHYSINSVQDYSREHGGARKTGFLSRDDQNEVVNIALQHRKSINAMKKLNEGQKRVAVTLGVAELNHLNMNIAEWRGGRKQRTGKMRSFVMVLGHFDGSQRDPEAPVHIHTAYPAL